MVAKKTIFEKLGLIEPVEGEAPENAEGVEEKTITEEAPVVAPTPTPEPVAKEKAEETKTEEPTPFGVDLLAAKKAPMGEDLLSKRANKTETVSLKEEESAQIEEKLDVLIGAYEKNKMMSIDDIYRNSRMEADKKKTIFMVDVFQKTLPENLPIDVKRASVMNIMDVSSINLENLLNDAFKRIDSLNSVLENTVNTTEEVLAKNNASIRELESRIKDLKKVIEARQQFQEDQTSVIEYEIQKIIGIVDFIKPKK